MVPHDTPPRGTVEAVIKDEKKKTLASRQCGKFVSELRSTTFCMARAIAVSLQVMQGTKKIRCVCQTQKTN